MQDKNITITLSDNTIKVFNIATEFTIQNSKLTSQAAVKLQTASSYFYCIDSTNGKKQKIITVEIFENFILFAYNLKIKLDASIKEIKNLAGKQQQALKGKYISGEILNLITQDSETAAINKKIYTNIAIAANTTNKKNNKKKN